MTPKDEAQTICCSVAANGLSLSSRPIILLLFATSWNPAPGIHAGRCFNQGTKSTRKVPGVAAFSISRRDSFTDLIYGSPRGWIGIPYARLRASPPRVLSFKFESFSVVGRVMEKLTGE